jgi:copper transport protein
LRVITKALLLIAGCALTGALAFVTFVTPAVTRAEGRGLRDRFDRLALRIAAGSIVVLAILGLFEILLQANELSSGVGDIFDTQWGERWLWRNLVLIPALLLVGGAYLAGPKRLVTGLGLVAAAGYLAITSSVSHSAAGAGSFWAAGSDFIHLLGASVWIGMLGLVVLLFLRARKELPDHDRYPTLVAILSRFSMVAVVSVALILFTGTINTVIEVSKPGDLLSTNYGNALLAKLALIVPLLFVGGANAYLFRPDLEDEVASTNRGSEHNERLAKAEQTLYRTIRWETGLAVLVLVVVALMVQLTPTRGRLDLKDTQGVFTGTAEQDNIAVTLQVDPRQPGNNTFSVYLAGDITNVESVRLNFWPNGDSSQESRLILDPSNPPTFYVGQGANVAQAGKWQIQVFVRRAAGTGSDVTIPFNVNVPLPGGTNTVQKEGSMFALPVDLTVGSAALILASGIFAVGIVFVSIRRPGLSGGYGTLVAEQVADRLPAVRPAWSLVVLVLFGIGLGLLVGAHRHGRLNETQAKAGNPVEATADSIARGQMLFSQNCTQCHGESGRGDGPLANSLPLKPANLYDHIPYHPDGFFFSVISEGVGGIMPSFKNSIAEEDRWNILNYLRATFSLDPPKQ